MDFGLARAVSDQSHLTQTGAILGTPAYMAPEQADGRPVDHRCDLFSLGCVLYRMCTGQLPFRGEGTIAILSALALDNPPPAAALNPEVPAELSDLVMQLLAKKPEERVESAQAVERALQGMVSGGVVSGGGPSLPLTTHPSPTPETPAPRVSDTLVPEARQSKERVRGFGTAKSEAPTMLGGQVDTNIAASETRARRASEGGTLAQPSLARRAQNRLLVASAAGLLLAAAAVAGILLFWQTPHGTVKIETSDPHIEIVFDKTGPTIKGAGKEPITLSARQHGLLVKRGDFSFETNQVLIKKGQTITLKIELLGSKLRILQDGQVIGSREVPLGKLFTNSLGMKMVLVPKGKFLMGGGGGNAGTKEVAILHDFYLGQYEVTQWEWREVMGNNPSSFADPGVKPRSQQELAKLTLDEFRKVKEEEERAKEKYWKTMPIELVSWDEAQEFIKRLNQKEKQAGWVYRLPTEAEWEYACRGGGDQPVVEYAFDYYFEKPTNVLLPDMANFEHGRGLKRTCKVGSYQPNRLGLYDMHGNVWEWCQDEIPGDPKDLKVASRRVPRGGSWFSGAGDCRAAYRGAGAPSTRSSGLGLRLARVPVGKEGK